MKTPRWWQTRNALSYALTPFSWLYALGFAVDKSFAKVQHAPLPSITIGNVTAGGAGKTPTAIAIAKLLHEEGQKPHFISRGYKGYTRHPQQVTPASDWAVVGDEPLLLAQVAPTWVCSDRFIAATLAAKNGATLIIMDDALQHHGITAHVNLLVIDGMYGLGNGALLPAGPLREEFAAVLERCHAVVMIGEDAQKLSSSITLPILQATLKVMGHTQYLREGKWIAFAGLARPQKFYDTLLSSGANLVATHDFADHYAYQETDIGDLLAEAERIGARLITTEKDAVKISSAQRSKLHVLPVQLEFTDPQALLHHLTTLIFPPKCPQ